MLSKFSFLATVYREGKGISDPLTLTVKLADTPCGPLNGNSPLRLLRELSEAGLL